MKGVLRYHLHPYPTIGQLLDNSLIAQYRATERTALLRLVNLLRAASPHLRLQHIARPPLRRPRPRRTLLAIVATMAMQPPDLLVGVTIATLVPHLTAATTAAAFQPARNTGPTVGQAHKAAPAACALKAPDGRGIPPTLNRKIEPARA